MDSNAQPLKMVKTRPKTTKPKPKPKKVQAQIPKIEVIQEEEREDTTPRPTKSSPCKTKIKPSTSKSSLRPKSSHRTLESNGSSTMLKRKYDLTPERVSETPRNVVFLNQEVPESEFVRLAQEIKDTDATLALIAKITKVVDDGESDASLTPEEMQLLMEEREALDF